MQRMLLFVLFIVLVLAVSLPAQIVISTNTYNPSPGTVLRSSSADIDENFYNSVTSGSGGGHLWDFSTVLFNDEDSSTIVNIAATPGAGLFTSATICWLGTSDNDSSWFYAESVPSHLTSLGYYARTQSAGDISLVYQNTAPDYVFPVAMGNTWTAYRHWTQVVAANTETSNADSTFYEVEAYGQIKYGSKTTDCLRIKSTERVHTTTTFNGMPISNTTTEIERYDFVTLDYLDAISVIKSVTPFQTIYSCGANLNSLEQLTPVVEYDNSALPNGYELAQNYPNPFNPSTTISYALPRSAEVTLDIINIAGQKVKSFDFGHQDAGNYNVEMNLSGDLSTDLSSGVYFYKLSAGDFTQTRKMMLLK